MIAVASQRMIEAGGGWWSGPLAVAVAERWHGASALLPCFLAAPHELRVRTALDAARRANDVGESALAAAYASLDGGLVADPELRLEREYARTVLGRDPGWGDGMPSLDGSDLEPAALRRCLELGTQLGPGRSLLSAATLQTLTAASDDATAAEIELALADIHSMDFEWERARTEADRVGHRPGIHPATRVRALLTSATSAMQLGEWSEAKDGFDRAERIFGPPGARTLGVRVQVWAMCVSILAHQVAGADASALYARLRRLVVDVARDGDPSAIVLAGLSTALAHVGAGNPLAALAEINAAARRSARLPLGPFAPIVYYWVAQSVALLDRPNEAREILHAADTCPYGRDARILEHARARAESTVLAAEGRIDAAIAYAETARDLSEGTDAALLLIRDLHQLAALGAGDDVLVHRMKRLAEPLDMPLAHLLAERAAGIVRGRTSLARRTPLELLRLGAPWTEGGVHRDAQRPAPDGAPATPAGIGSNVPDAHSRVTPFLGLTRREREIGTLVAQGLGNREIADRLYLSVRTVESHVYQARAKLGARSRAELGRIISGRQRDAASRGDGSLGR